MLGYPDNIIIKGKGSSGFFWETYYKSISKGETVELWTLNEDILPETSRHFDIHLGGGHHLRQVGAKWGSLKSPVCCYVNDDVKEWKDYYCDYPIDLVRSIVPPSAISMASTLSYMIALAGVIQPRRVFLAGCDFANITKERIEQKEDAERWIYFLYGRGCEVVWPHMSTFFNNKIEYK